MKIDTLVADLSLQNKLIANIAMLALFMAMILGVGWFTSVQMDRGFHEVLDGPVVMRDIMRQAYTNVLAARSSQRQYLLTRNPEDVKEVGTKVAQAIDMLEQLQSIDEYYGHEDDAKRNREIILLLQQYLTAFDGVVKAWQVKGLDDNSGLRAELGTAIRELSGLLQNFDTAEVRIQLSDVIIHHQEYMNKRDEATLQGWNGSLEMLDKAIQKSEISHFDKDKFKESIDRYKAAFGKLVSQPVGEEVEQTQAKWEEVAHILDPVMETVKRYYIRNISLDFSVLRRYERDYLLMGEARSVKRFNDSVKKMQDNVSNAKGVPEKMRVDVTSFLTQYQQNFLKLVEQDQEITRLRDVMRKSIEDIAPILDEHVTAAEKDAVEAAEEINKKSNTLLVTMVAVGLLATVLAGFFNRVMGRGILQQVGDEPSVLEAQAVQVASGDLTIELAGGTGIRQAMGQMVHSLRRFAKHGALQSETISAVVGQQLLAKEELNSDISALVEKMERVLSDNHALDLEVSRLQEELQQISSNTEQTSYSTDELASEFSAISNRVVRAGDNLSRVAHSSHQASMSLEEMRSAMADTGDNISTVASAVEEMTANLAGVRSRCQEANSEALQAQKDARATAEVMERLRRTTREIGKVVEVIKSIAEQTNLLALNASIEAAGAGALGRGFAVVASEVKELASQTRKATDTIRKQVEGIQVNTSEASKATDRVFQTIGNLAQSNEEILNAVSDQTQALNEITQSVAMVSQQTGEVVELVNRTTLELTEVDQQIQEISTAVTEVGRNVQDGVNTSRNVAQQALDSRERALRMLQQAQVMVDAALAVKERALEAKDRMGYLQGTTRQIGQLVEVVSVVSRELGTAQQQFRVGSSRIDIQSLKAAHLAWMMELNQLFSGRLQVMASVQEGACDICQVLAGVMEEEGEEGMVAIQQGHQKLHTLLREIIALKEQGSDSSQVLDEFNKERVALFDAMDHLYLG